MSAARTQLENEGAHLVVRALSANVASLERLCAKLEAQVRRNNAVIVWARLQRIMWQARELGRTSE